MIKHLTVMVKNINCNYCNDTRNIENVFIVGDLRQAEAMVVAHCLRRCGYPKLYELFQQPGFDVHTWAAAPIFNCSEKDVEKYQREVGKLSNHSGNYGSGPRVLVDKALKDGLKGIDYSFAKHILEKRHEQLPGLKKWWKEVEKNLRQTRVLATCFGRRRIFFGRLDEATFRDAYSYEPQSTVGDVCNQIFWKLWKTFRRDFRDRSCSNDSFGGYSKGRIWMGSASLQPVPLIQIHDEVVTKCPNIPEIINYVIEEYYKAANIPLQICSDITLTIPIELKIGKNWKDTKDSIEDKN